MEVTLPFPLIVFAPHAVRNACQEGSEQFLEFFQISRFQRLGKLQCQTPGAFCRFQIIGGDGGQKALLHLVVRKIQQEGFIFPIVILDGQVAALVNGSTNATNKSECPNGTNSPASTWNQRHSAG